MPTKYKYKPKGQNPRDLGCPVLPTKLKAAINDLNAKVGSLRNIAKMHYIDMMTLQMYYNKTKENLEQVNFRPTYGASRGNMTTA